MNSNGAARHQRDAGRRPRPRDGAQQRRARRRRLRPALHRPVRHGRDRHRRRPDGRTASWPSTRAASRRCSSARRAPARSKTRDTIENDTNGGSCIYCNLYDVTFDEPRRAGRAGPAPAELHAQRRRPLPDALRLLRRAAVPRGARRARRAADPRRERRPDRRRLRLLAGGAGLQSGAVLRRGRGHARGLRQRQLRRARTGSRTSGLRWIDTDTTARTAIDSIVRVDDPDAGRPDLEPGRDLQPGRAVHGERQLQQGPAVAQRRLLAAQGHSHPRRRSRRSSRGRRSTSSRRREPTSRSTAPTRCSTTAMPTSSRSRRTRPTCRSSGTSTTSPC